ncbi:MAG TPA: histidine kinase [Clostridiaceae bacterium]|nr:histidine kinase [Clostridiaceae bacterium]
MDMKSLMTISRETGSLGDKIAEGLAKELSIPHIHREYILTHIMPHIATAHELHMLRESPGYFLKKGEKGQVFQQYLTQYLQEAAAKGPLIISGLGAQVLFRDHKDAVHVRILGSEHIRRMRIMKENNLAEEDAARIQSLTDRKHRKYIQLLFQEDWSNPALYHLSINTDHVSVPWAIALLKHAMLKEPKEDALDTQAKPFYFKNEAEEEFAKVLDLYSLAWTYEPRTFPLAWDQEGNITKAFSPDFYLPHFDTYIELTIMNQKYTKEKKKKLALVRKLYPGINVTIVYKNDYHKLLERFGKWGAIHE